MHQLLSLSIRLSGRSNRPCQAVSALALAGALSLVLSGCATIGGGEVAVPSEVAVPAAQQSAAEAPTAAPSEPPEFATPTPGLELDDNMKSDPAVRRGSLTNGLEYYIRTNPRPRARAELRLAIKAGSILEDDDQQGLAHFLEHMAFNGTENFEKQELVDYLESIGMRFGPDLNAYTSFDETVYMLQIPTDDEGILDRGFLILADWASGLSLDPEEIEKERGVVIEEWRLGRGAGARVRDKQFPLIFHHSRYADRLPIGQREILEAFEPEVLRRFYDDWYRPELMAIVAVGDFDPDGIERRIRDLFEPLENPPEPRERFLATVPSHEETLVSVVTDPELTRSTISINYKFPERESASVAEYRESLVETIWSSMLNGRLAERVQETDPPYLGAFSSEGALSPDTGSYSLSAAVADGGMQRGLEALLTEARRARRHGFTQGELDRAREDILRFYDSAYEERDKTESRLLADEYVRNFLTNEPYPGIAIEREVAHRYLPGVTLAEVDALSSRFLGTENRVILASLPEKESLVPPTEEELLRTFERVEATEVEPYVDRVHDGELLPTPPTGSEITERQRIDALDVDIWTLGNGVRVILKTTDFKNDQVTFSAFSPGGHSLVGDLDFMSASNASSMVTMGGLADLDVIQLQKALAGTAAGVSPYIGELSEGMQGGASPEDLELMFQLAYLYGTAPRCDEKAFASFQVRLRAALENQEKQPGTWFSRELVRALGGDHPRRQPMTIESVDDLDLDTACRVYKERFRDFSDFTFVIVGAFNLESIEPLVTTYLGGLPSTGREETWRDIGIERPDGVVVRTVERGIEPKSLLRLVFHGPFEQSVENRFELSAMATLLETRLREVLREELGGTYGVGVNSSSQLRPRTTYSVSIGFAADPEKLEVLTEAMFDQIDKLKKDPATELELTKIKEQMRRERETAVRTNGFWLRSLAFYFEHQLDPLEILSYEDRVSGLDAEAIAQAARRYLNEDRYVQVSLFPEAEPAAGETPSETSPSEESQGAEIAGDADGAPG